MSEEAESVYQGGQKVAAGRGDAVGGAAIESN